MIMNNDDKRMRIFFTAVLELVYFSARESLTEKVRQEVGHKLCDGQHYQSLQQKARHTMGAQKGKTLPKSQEAYRRKGLVRSQ